MINTLKNTFIRLDNWINPIVVKEMRQAVRSRYIMILLLLFLLLEALLVGTYFVTDDPTVISSGKNLFSTLIFVLFFTNLFCVPIYTSNRLWKEIRQGDAMFSTVLTPMQIIRGKFFSGLIISLLLFSVATPFVILTYLMRGLDLSEIILTLYWLFLLTQLFNCCGIVFAALNLNAVIKILVCIFGSIVLVNNLGNVWDLIQYFSALNIHEFIIGTVWILFLGETCLTLAGSLLSPIASNRMTRPRIFMTISSFLLILLSGLINYVKGNGVIFEGTCTYLFVLMLLFLTISLCERTKLSSRQTCQIPHHPVLRVLYYPFFTGVGPAVAWFFLLIAGLSLLVMFYSQLLDIDSSKNIFLRIYTSELLNKDELWRFLLMCLGYITAGLVIRIGMDFWRRKRLAQQIPDNPPIVVYPNPQSGIMTLWYTVILLTITTFVPAILFLNDILFNKCPVYLCLSPFYYIYAESNPSVPLIFGTVSCLILLGYSLYSFAIYYRQGGKHIN